MEILVKFKNRNSLIVYTKNILEMLKTEKEVEYILDAFTGELIFENN